MFAEADKTTQIEFDHTLHSLTLTQRQLCDFELLFNGGFSPLTGFMNQSDYHHVLDHMRLADATLWPIPINLDIDQKTADRLPIGTNVALRDGEGLLLAILHIEEYWLVDRKREAQLIYGTNDDNHPGVHYLFHQTQDVYVSGNLTFVSSVHYYDFNYLRHTPQQLKNYFKQYNWQQIVAFQTRNPMHRAHQELTMRAIQQTGAKLLIHPVVGMTMPGDIEYFTRVKCYEHIMSTYPSDTALLSLLPLAMRMGGPREAIWHAIIRKNYGCTHFIMGRDHAGPGKNKRGHDFYAPYAAQELALQHQKEIGLTIVPFQEMVYSHTQNKYFTIDEFPKNETPAMISGTTLRNFLQNGLDIPEWFSYPAVIHQLRKSYPPRYKQGFTVFMTGLPSAGKSTLANALSQKLREIIDRKITILDGDVIRTHLSRDLSFSREDREKNITRVGFIAKEITRHGGITICALVAPFVHPRKLVRQMIQEVGGFIEVYVSTPLTVCEARDRKGMYQKARKGEIKQFTGISDPYESPTAAEVVIDTSCITPELAIDLLIKKIQALGYLQKSRIC